MGLTTWFCLEISLKKNRCHVCRLRRFRPQVWKTMGCRGSKTIPSSGPVDCGGFHKSWEYPRDMDMDGLFPWENPWNHGWFGESPELERKPLLLIPLVGHHFIIARKWWMWIVSAHVWISHCHRCWHSFQAKQRILVLLSDWAYFPCLKKNIAFETTPKVLAFISDSHASRNQPSLPKKKFVSSTSSTYSWFPALQ